MYLCQRTKPKNTKQRLYYGRIPVEYIPWENLAVDLKKMPMGILYYTFLLIATCEKTNFVHAIPMQIRKTQTVADALLHWVCCLTGPPTKLSIDQDSALTSEVIKELLTSLECTMQIISPWNHGSSKAERQIQTIGNMINKHLMQKGASWPLYAAVSAYAMNTFASTALQGLSPFESTPQTLQDASNELQCPKQIMDLLESRSYDINTECCLTITARSSLG